jgi:hypothetical protein
VGASVPLARSRDQRREDEDLEREGRVRTAISGLETRRISKAMLLPHWDAKCDTLADCLTELRIRRRRHGRPVHSIGVPATRRNRHPRAPRTRKKSGTPRAEQTCAKITRVSWNSGWTNRSERKAGRDGNAGLVKKRLRPFHRPPERLTAAAVSSAGRSSQKQAQSHTLVHVPLPARSHPGR